MNPFSGIEKLINEHGSATILKERIALMKEQHESLQRKNDELAEKLRIAEAKVVVLESENQDFKRRLQDESASEINLSEQTISILKFLFDYGDEASADFVAYSLGLQESIAEHHFDILRKHHLIRMSRAFMRTADIGRSGPAYRLTPEGRSTYIEIQG